MKKPSTAHRIELLEARIAPATLIGLDHENRLLIFDSATPGTMIGTKTVSELPAEEELIGIDFRPATGGLYGVTKDAAGTGRIYLLNPATGVATFSALLQADPTDISAPYANLAGTSFGTDFNPVMDRLRLVSDTGANLRVNVDNGFVTTDGSLNPVGSVIAGSAYTNSFSGATGTTLYGLDIVADQLVIQIPPNNGTLVNVGAFGVQADAVGGFDVISTRSASGTVTNTAFAALTEGGVTKLYTVNLTTGAASLQGNIFNGAVELRGMTAQIDAPSAKAYAVDDSGKLLSFDTATPNVPTTIGPLTGLGAGEAVIGIDFRPANGLLYAVTKNAVGAGHIYTINLATAAATLVTTLTSSATPFPGLQGDHFGVDFNPVVDRMRIVSDSGQNLRVELSLGLVAVDSPLNGASTTSVHAAYTNNFAGATATTLYGIDSVTDQLTIQNPSNAGTLTPVGVLGVDATAVGGFDIRANGQAFATLTVAGEEGLYRIDLGSGAATLIGPVGGPATALGLALAPSGTLQFAETALAVAEGGGTAQFTINRVGGSEGTVSVVVSTGGAGAVAGTDYTGFSRVLTFAPGETSRTFTVTLLDDMVNEANTQFTVTLSDVVGGAALNASNVSTVNIQNDDPLSLTPRVVTYTDGDGDLVTLKITKGTLNPELLKFVPAGAAGGIQLQAIDLTDDAFLNTNLTVTAKRVAERGDSFANVGHINALGNLLGTVTIDGDLGQIDAASVKALTAQSMGRLGLATQGAGGSLVSDFTGNLNKLTVKTDLHEASIVAVLKLGAVNIGGNLTGGSADFSGRLEAANIASVKILGSLQAGPGVFSGSIIAKTVGAVNIRGDIDGGSILLSGNAGATTPKLALALRSLTVGGNVENGRVLVGYDRAAGPVNAEVAAGAIKVTGDWIATDLAVGVQPGDDGAYGTDDDRLTGPVGGVVAKIASLAIRGQILGTTSSTTDRFGFAAEEIGSFKLGKAKLAMTKAGLEAFDLGPTQDVRVKETNVAG